MGQLNPKRSSCQSSPSRIRGRRTLLGAGNPNMFVNEPEFDVWKNYLGNLVLSKQVPNEDFYKAHPCFVPKETVSRRSGCMKNGKCIGIILVSSTMPKCVIWDWIMTCGTKIQSSTGRKFLRWAAYHWRLPCDPHPLPCSWAFSRFFQLIPRYRAKILAGRGGGRGAAGAGHGGRGGQGVDAESPTTPTPFLRRTLRFPPSMETVLTEHMTPKIQMMSQTNTTPKRMNTGIHMVTSQFSKASIMSECK